MPYFSLLNFTDAEVREVLYLMLDANDIEFMDRYRDLGLPMRSSTVELIEKHFVLLRLGPPPQSLANT